MATTPPIREQDSNVEDHDMLPIEVGQSIWVPSMGESVWELGEVTAIDDLTVTVRTQSANIQQIHRGLSLPQNPRVADDMAALYYIHEAGVLHNLAERSKLDGPDGSGQKPYTFMANVLIAVNPLRNVPGPRISDVVASAGVLPHPFAVAEMAYQQMVINSGSEQPTNQSIVISGESGAGKTESSKIVLRHLTARGFFGKNAKPAEIEAHYVHGHKNKASDFNSLDERLIEQNPILEAFGNAKTLHNHNSSRFGKFTKLQFTQSEQFQLSGACVEAYMLEKSRLAFQVAGERNFHIFYQLLSGASLAMKTELSLTTPEDYAYLNQSGCYVAEDTDDEANFEAVVCGLSCVGVDDATQRSVFSVIAGLLHLGNVDLDEKHAVEGEIAAVEKQAALTALTHAAQLLGVTKEGLEHAITVRDIVTPNETFKRRLNVQEATYARDAIAKALYGRLFDWVIKQVNKSLGQDPAPLPYIGVLDVFGFESFQRNGFEQLLINYTNEVLQATFAEQVFIAETELYKREGIAVGTVEWPDNRECVKLIAGKPDGILLLLDAEAMNPKPSDEKFLALLHRTHATNSAFIRPHPKDMKAKFIIRHFAGEVSYSIGEFMTKNNDSIPQDMVNVFLSSSSQLVVSLFKCNDKDNARLGKRKFLKSVAAKFSRQMKELVDVLDSTRCSFIRCIKPNALMRVGLFEPRYVVGQLRCQGIIQTAQVLKVGLPTRVSYSELVGTYKASMPPAARCLFSNQSDPTMITAILWAFQVPVDAYKLGITRLFFRAGKMALLGAILKMNWTVDGPRVVARLKLWLARRRWRVGLAKLVSQSRFKKLLRRMKARRDTTVRIQQWWRGLCIRREFMKTKSAAILVQALFRGNKARVFSKHKRQVLIAIAEAEEMRCQAQEAVRMEDEALNAADIARRTSIACAAQEDVARKATAAEHEHQAELIMIAEAREFEVRIQDVREDAACRNEEAPLCVVIPSFALPGFQPQIKNISGATGAVNKFEIPDHLAMEHKEQLQQLSELVRSGVVPQSEYDEFVASLLDRPACGQLLAAREMGRLPSERLPPFYERQLVEVERAVSMLGQALGNARGDVRRDSTVQDHLAVCELLLPRLQVSAALDSPFADLIPRAKQCLEDLMATIKLYNDSLVAADVPSAQ